MKKIDGNEVEHVETEFGVEFDVNGETFTTWGDDEDDARLKRAALNGTLVAREWYATAAAVVDV